jgi:hypothetical protein
MFMSSRDVNFNVVGGGFGGTDHVSQDVDLFTARFNLQIRRTSGGALRAIPIPILSRSKPTALWPGLFSFGRGRGEVRFRLRNRRDHRDAS